MRALVRLPLYPLVCFLLVAAPAAQANHSFCVTSSGGTGSVVQLRDALNYAVTASDETVYVHLEQGTYTLPGDNGFNQDGNGGNANLHVVGGFVPGTSCQQRQLDPANTVIHGAPEAPGTYARFGIGQEEGELLIDGIKFDSFPDGVDVWTSADSTATVRNVIVTGMGNQDGFTLGALTLETHNVTGASKIRVENCLIYGNNSASGLDIIQQHDGDSGQVLNCTIVNNAGYGLFLGAGDIGTPLSGTFVAYNNIIRGNSSADIKALNVVNEPTVDYSDFNSVTGPVAGTHNVNVDPVFVNPGNAEYELQTISPLVNAGAAASLVSGGYASTDLRGRKRVIGSHVDFGPYETLVDDTANQVVQLLADTPTGATLRAAIATANANNNPTTITFDVTGDGNCPHVIVLDSLLPDITSDITIDGYTQPGAAPNSTAPGWNGTLCIVLNGFGLDHGLQVGNGGRLTVRGIEFEDFSTAAIRLGTGSGHVVVGNGFSTMPSSASKYGVLIEGSATSSQIGSYAFGDRNVFEGSSDAAIRIASNGAGQHLIQGNYIGFDPDGTSGLASANKYGIYAVDSGADEISYNYIGNSVLYALFFSGAASSGNHVVENGIGYAPADGSAAGNGAGSGCLVCFALPAVEFTSGAHDNYVGAIGGNGGNNVIVDNYGGGVYVDQTAGTGNRIYGNNLIHDNGGSLAIDLGGVGPTLNDVGDGDFGGNNLQNYPTLSQAMRIEANVVRLSGSLVAQNPSSPQLYRLDVYWTDTCLFAGQGADTPRGELKRYVGFLDVYGDGTVYNLPFSSEDIFAATNIPKPGPSSPGYLFAIATDGNGNTSEPGPCRAFVDDYIFSDGF